MYTLYPSKLTLARLHVNNRNKQHQTAGRTYVRIKGLLSLCCILTFHVSAVVSVTYATEDSCSLRHTSSTSTDFRIIAAYRTTNESQNFPTNQLTNLAAMSTVVSPLSRLRWRQTIIQRDTHESLGKGRIRRIITFYGLLEQAPLVIFEDLIYGLDNSSVFGGWFVGINSRDQAGDFLWWCPFPQIKWMLCNDSERYTEPCHLLGFGRRTDLKMNEESSKIKTLSRAKKESGDQWTECHRTGINNLHQQPVNTQFESINYMHHVSK